MKRHTLSPVRSALDRVFKTVLFAALLVSLNALGEPTSAKQAASMVKGWLLLTPAPLKTPLSGRTIGSVQAFYDQNGEAIYYAVPLQPEGFIITSADTEIEGARRVCGIFVSKRRFETEYFAWRIVVFTSVFSVSELCDPL